MSPRTRTTFGEDWRRDLREGDVVDGSGQPMEAGSGGPDAYQQLEVKQRTSEDKPDLGEREIEFVASTGGEDRDGDIVRQTGIDLGPFKKNPVFLWVHDQQSEPIGKVTHCEIREGRMVAVVRFPEPGDEIPDDEHGKFVERIFQMYRHGYLNAVSIGFIADPDHVSERDGGGFEFRKIEVLELSAVPVQSNRGAVALRRDLSEGLGEKYAKTLDDWAQHWLDARIKQPEAFDPPPEAVRENLRAGLEWVEAGFGGDGLQGSTIEWARRMAGGETPTEDKARKMASFFARHLAQDGPLRDDDGDPTPRAVALKLWGGKEAGPAYVRSLYRSVGWEIPEGLADKSHDAPDTDTTDMDDTDTNDADDKDAPDAETKEGRTLRKDLARKAGRIRREADEMLSEEGLEDGVTHEEEFFGDMPTPTAPADETDRTHPDEEEMAASLSELKSVLAKELSEDVASEVVGILDAKQSAADVMAETIGGMDDFDEGAKAEFIGLLEEDMRRNETLIRILGLDRLDRPQMARLSPEMGDDARSLEEEFPVKEQAATADKMATEFQDLPLAARDREWGSEAAVGRWREFSGSEEEPGEQYRDNFMWFDDDAAQNFGAYKLPYGDIVDDTHVAVPRAIFAIAAALEGARGGVDIPESDIPDVRDHAGQYYAKMREEFDDDAIVAPWATEDSLETWAVKQAQTPALEGAEVKEALDLASNPLSALTVEADAPATAPDSDTPKSVGGDADSDAQEDTDTTDGGEAGPEVEEVEIVFD